jgi:hypothetical protein
MRVRVYIRWFTLTRRPRSLSARLRHWMDCTSRKTWAAGRSSTATTSRLPAVCVCVCVFASTSALSGVPAWRARLDKTAEKDGREKEKTKSGPALSAQHIKDVRACLTAQTCFQAVTRLFDLPISCLFHLPRFMCQLFPNPATQNASAPAASSSASTDGKTDAPSTAVVAAAAQLVRVCVCVCVCVYTCSYRMPMWRETSTSWM